MDRSWPAGYFRRRGIYYGWVIVGVMFITLFISLGFRFAFGVFYSAILDETGWQRAETASVMSASMLVYAFTAALFGYLFDRLGARVLFPIGTVLMGGGLMLCATISTLTELVLAYGVLLGLSFAALGFIPHMAIVPRWFVRRRGFASAITLAGSGVGALVVAAISGELIPHIGWRNLMWYYGIGTMLILVPLNIVFHRASPAAVGLEPDGVPRAAGAPAAPAVNHTAILAAVRSAPFWWLSVSSFAIGFCLMVMLVHQTRLLVDMGFSLALASLLFGVMGISRTIGGLFWGPLSDRMGRGSCVAVVTAIGVTGLLLLLAAGQVDAQAATLRTVLVTAYVAAFGVGQGVAPVYAAVASDRFSGRNLGTILGLMDLGFGFGCALGPWWAGWMFDRSGSYTAVILGTIAGVVLTGIALIVASRTPPPAAPQA